MGTEKFFVFNEAGTLKRLKGRIVRFLDNEEPDNDDKVAIRSSLSVPASAEGLTPANNLSDVSNAATSRANLSVNSVDEDAEAIGTKLLGPSVYFDGSNDVVTVADDSRFTFSDGSDDLPFTISGWVNVASNAKNFTLFAAWNNFREFTSYIDTNGKLTLGLSDGTNDTYALGSTVIPTDQWTHVSIRYSGAGPNSANGFNANQNGTTIFVNGVAETVTPFNSASYGGLVNRVQVHTIGSSGSSFAKGHIRNAQIFNRELTAAEVADLAKGNELGFADEFGGALGGVYTSNFAADSTDSWTANQGAVDATTTVGGEADNIQYTINTSASSSHYVTRTVSGVTAGKLHRVEFDVYIPSGQSNIDGIACTLGGAFFGNTTPTPATWQRVSVETVPASTALRIYATDGGSTNITDPSGDDYFAIRNVKITQLGTLADFRSERFDSSTNKWYDLANGFVGTNSGATLVGREVGIYETGTWTPSITFGGGSTGVTYGLQEGYYTRVGNQVTISCSVTLTSKGSDTGGMKITGLPFTAANLTDSQNSLSVGLAINLTALTSPLTALMGENTTNISLYDWGATGAVEVTDANATATTNIRLSGTYQIQ